MVTAAAAANFIDTLALLLLATEIVSVLARRIESGVRLLAAQGLLLAAASAALALSAGGLHAYFVVALTLAVKVVAVPGLLLRTLGDVRVKHEIEPVIPRPLALIVALALVFVAYSAAGSLLALPGLAARNALPSALAMLLIGLFTMLVRKQALSQVIGLVAMENGLFLAAVVATHGLPLAVELGVALDVLVGVVVMLLVVRQIHRQFDTLNTDRLTALRG